MSFDSRLVLLLSTAHDEEQSIRIRRKLHKMAELPSGWSNGAGECISPCAIEVAEEFILSAEWLDLRADVFPNLDGGCAVAFYEGDNRIEVNIDATGTKLSLRIERGIGFEYEVIVSSANVTVEELKEILFYLHNSQLWKLSESSTSASLTEQSGDLGVSPVRTRPSAREHRPPRMVKGGSQSSTMLVPVMA